MHESQSRRIQSDALSWGLLKLRLKRTVSTFGSVTKGTPIIYWYNYTQRLTPDEPNQRRKALFNVCFPVEFTEDSDGDNTLDER
ncbi:hypothetical protein PABG_12623 [Paracoccidioides brasiliensis Pb03]|nr:hypothetical protein PABG_12623 [Paracoccidioides brasiliensis Pb03]